MILKCVTLIEKTPEDMINASKRSKEMGADLVELRLDFLEQPTPDAVQTLKNGIQIPAIITIRPETDGGSFKGSEQDRVQLLEAAIKAKFDYVDVEMKMEKDPLQRLIKMCNENNVVSIVSYHDFESTPSSNDMFENMKKCIDLGGKVAKIAVMTKVFEDVVEIFKACDLAKNDGFEFIAIGMGVLGYETRIHAPLMGSKIAYTSLERGKEAVKGQIDLETLKKKWELLDYK
ncbi:MAG: type I 3-dehydroquinate dehydratase [Thermoplasmata archaeon]